MLSCQAVLQTTNALLATLPFHCIETNTPMTITTQQTRAVLEAGVEAAANRKFPPVSISIVDDHAHLIGFLRMDGAMLGGIDVAHRKARTTALFKTNSAELASAVSPDSPAFTLANSNGGLVAFPGGVLLKDAAGLIHGAVGVSGASVHQDEVIAQATSESFTLWSRRKAA